MKKVEVGQFVVVNDLPDTQVYVVDRKEDERTCVLVYRTSNTLCQGGKMDVSLLKKPTAVQYENALRSFYM